MVIVLELANVPYVVSIRKVLSMYIGFAQIVDYFGSFLDRCYQIAKHHFLMFSVCF